jgi:hypothetical protein
MDDEQPQMLRVGFRGTLVTCHSLGDALAIGRAAEILDAGRLSGGSPVERFTLIDALVRCGQPGAATELRRLGDGDIAVRFPGEPDRDAAVV